ncbi:PVC-type heme-binding CxxCH protein [Pedosphaera parvula]|uniref:Membrane-bound dehydrogenase domain protein n=1 Tax=Pedosphaera parvula (strain Ellin514) TaxID=320771 RepID=B9XPZ2_PEDPL|nr:PVC-type heme-binding CxxCH protein [Pedosphaera parvula]EEF58089.1 membrane-bound dehydrogenase domain protein [Pedosphaera parvula Ellin514]
MKCLKAIALLLCVFALSKPNNSCAEDKKKIVLVAGTPSHGPREHEHNAGVLLLKKCLDKVPDIEAIAYTNGWPKDAKAFDGAATILLYMDGGDHHLAIQDHHLDQLQEQMKRGCGLVCIHYAVEVPSKPGGMEFLNWIGGYFETNWSVNPNWEADFKDLPPHPVTRGVKPFKIQDEWYYHMRFQEEDHVTPILTAIPPDSTREHPDDPHGGNPVVRSRKGMPEDVAWAYQRPDGGRGFGFTGAHHHENWGNDDFRKIVLNAIVWTAQMDVPPNGIESTITPEDLEQNLDPKGPKKVAKKSTPPPNSPKPKYASGIIQSGQITVDADITGAKSLYLVVTDGGNGIGCDWADWVNPQLVRADGTSVKLTSLKWKLASAGWGNVNVDKNAAGGPLKVGQKVAKDGIGTHSPSLIEFELPENFTHFLAKAGIDQGGIEQNCGSAVQFMVFTEKPDDSLLKVSSGENFIPPHQVGPDAARESLKNFTVAPGLEVSLFASEPMLRNPTDMDIDERGRIWITEGVNYRSTIKPWGILDPKGDRIVVLEDTDGDGVADKETTFYQGPEINAALGICVLGNKVIVSSSPNIFVLTDTGGDGKADKKELLFTGISGVDDDHGVHAVSFGPDGKLYFNFGNHAGQLKDKDGKPVMDIDGNEVINIGKPYRNGMAVRCNLDGTGVEVLAHNFRNPYEVAVDSFGTVWQSDNDDDGNRSVRINYLMEHGNFGYADEMTGEGWTAKRTGMEEEIQQRHWHQNDPGVVPNLLITGAGAPTGIAIYEGNLLPKAFQNQIILCDAGPRTVRAYPVEARGGGYKAECVDLLSSSDSWFRPSDVCVAPDGSIYVADWNDAGVGGHNMADRDPARMTGRVYRIAPVGFKPSVPKLDLTTPAGCVNALASPNLSTRYVAWMELKHMGIRAESELLKVWQDTKANPRMRARALYFLSQIKGTEHEYVKKAVLDSNPDIRIAGLRAGCEAKLDMTLFVKALVYDPSDAVRRECAITLRHSNSPKAPKLWATLATQHDGKDRWYLEALGIGMDKQEDKFFEAWLAEVGDKWNTPRGHDVIWRSRSSKALPYLVKIISDKNTSPRERDHYFRALDFISGPEKDAALLELLSASAPSK